MAGRSRPVLSETEGMSRTWSGFWKSFPRWETRLEFRGLTSGDPGLGTITDPNAPELIRG